MNINQKGFTNIVLVVIVVVVLAGYFIIVRKSSVPNSASTHTNGNATTQVSSQGLESTPSDSGSAELTVISVFGDHVGTVKIDKIINYTRDPRANYKLLEEGFVTDTANFNFGSQSAVVKHFPLPTKIPSTSTQPTLEGSRPPATEATNLSIPVPGGGGGDAGKESKPRVYSVYSGYSKEYETILPGFKNGDKIRAQIRFDGSLSIGEYELLK